MHGRMGQFGLALLLFLLPSALCSASPDFAVSLMRTTAKVVPGQTAEFVVQVDFLDGFSTTGITLQVPEAPAGAASFTPSTLTREGGSLLRIATGTIAPAVYNWHVEAASPGGGTRSAPFTLEVAGSGEIEFYTFDESYHKVVLTSLTFSNQSVTDIYVSVRDTNGFQFAQGTPVTLTSGNTTVLQVYPHPDGYHRAYSSATGSTSLTATTLDGYSSVLPVSISIPLQPKITSISAVPVSVTNKGDTMITFQAVATNPLTSVAYDGLELVNDVSNWYDGNRSYTGTGYVPEGYQPGTYFFRAEIAYQPSVRVAPLVVTNDPARGEIRGAVYPLPQGGPSAVSGLLEVYDLAGSMVGEHSVTERFSIGYIQPGTYRLRFVPSPSTNLSAQWWPNALAFASASNVAVTAGGTAADIFFFPASDGQIPPQVVSTSPADDEVGVTGPAFVTAVFSKPMNVSTINTDTFRVTEGLGTPVPGTVTCADGVTATFTPSAPFARGAAYHCLITTGVTDAGGLSLTQNRLWNFLTAADADLLSEARSLPDGVSVSLSGKVVHLKQETFAYISETDRSSGMRLQGSISGAEGEQTVSLKGVMATTLGGERYIQVQSASSTGPGSLEPVGTVIRALQDRIMDGLNVIAWGSIVEPPSANSFVLSDGSGATVRAITSHPHGMSEGTVTSACGAAGWDGGRVIYIYNSPE